MQDYLQALACLAQPPLREYSYDDDEHSAALERLRTWLGVFLRGGTLGEASNQPSNGSSLGDDD